MTTNSQYLPQYEVLKNIPNNDWLFFVSLKYRRLKRPVFPVKTHTHQIVPEPQRYVSLTNRDIFQDVKNWLRTVSQPMNLRPDDLVWFGRIENTMEDGEQVVPRHVHLCIHRQPFESRFKNSDHRPWNKNELKFVLTEEWKHQTEGECWIEDYDPNFTTPTGVGYCLKNESPIEEIFVSKGLRKILEDTNTFTMEEYLRFTDEEIRERYKDRDPLMVGLLLELRKSDKRVWFMDEYWRIKEGRFHERV